MKFSVSLMYEKSHPFFLQKDEKVLEFAFFISLVFVVFTLPYSTQLNSLFIIILSSIWILKSVKNKLMPPFQDKRFWILTSIFLISIVGLINTENINQGLNSIETKLGLFIFPLILSSSNLKKERIEIIIEFFILSCVIVALISQIDAMYLFVKTSYNISFGNYMKFTYLDRNYPFLVRIIDIHPSYLGLYLNFGAAYIFQRITSEYRNNQHLSIKLIILLIYIILFILQLAAAMPIIILSIILVSNSIYFLIFFNKRKYWVTSAIICSISIALVLYLKPTPYQRLVHRIQINFNERYNEDVIKQFSLGYSPNNRDTRAEIWESTWIVFSNNWLAGVGTGDGQIELNKQYASDGKRQALRNSFNTHNQYLDISLHFGIFGLFVFGSFLVFLFVKASKTQNILYLAFLMMVCIALISENILSRQKGVVFFAVFNSLLFYHSSLFSLSRVNSQNGVNEIS